MVLEKTAKTNADRIRAMSDEELAKFLEQVGDGGSCSVCGNLSRCRRNNAPEPVCSRHIKEWLQQPAPEEIIAVAGLASANCAKTADAVDKPLSEDAELKSYRALGPVEELAALVKAKDEGRVLVSPIALGKKIYKFSPLKSGVLEWTVIQVMKSKTGFDFEIISDSGITHRVSDEYIGKTVFLTRAEAEAVLGGGGDGS